MNIKPLIDAVEILEEAKLVTIDEKDRLEIGHAIFKVRCVLQKHGVFLGGSEKKSEPPPATFIPIFSTPEELSEFQIKTQTAIAKVVHENNLRIDQLTEAQCTQAIIQAFQCGDFKRLVRASDNAQQVVYVPFEECEALKAELDKLKTTHQPGDPEMRWDDEFGWLHVIVLESINEIRTERDGINNALDNYWRTNPDTLSAVQAAVADANKFRLALSRLMEKFTGATLDNVVDVVCAYATTADGQLKLMESIKSAPCVTRVSVNDEGHAFVVYLRDGKKITVGRGSRTIGPAWLEVLDQATLKAM